MRFFSKDLFRTFNRSAALGLTAAGLFFIGNSMVAQRPLDKGARSGLERIDVEEGKRRLERFRKQRLEGDFVFEFQLEHKPRRSRTVRYDGIMWGSWNEAGPVTRFRIFPAQVGVDDSDNEPIELIVQNGPAPEAWFRRDGSSAFEPVVGDRLFEPVLPGLLYSVFDLQMPFIYWHDFTYEGPSLIGASRVAQRFLMQPPEDYVFPDGPVKGVRVSLDDTYNALWRVEVVNEDESVRSRFSVESFKKVQEQYIVKRITLTDYVTKDRTTFHVREATVGLDLDPDLFEWNRSGVAVPVDEPPLRED